MRMSVDLRDLFLYEAFLYYNPLLLVVSEYHLFFRFLSIIVFFFTFSFLVSTHFLFAMLMQTMMVWLWGVNLWVFLQASVNYAKIFDLDQNHLTHREIWKVPKWTASGLTWQLHNSLWCSSLCNSYEIFVIVCFEYSCYNTFLSWTSAVVHWFSILKVFLYHFPILFLLS